MSDALPIDLSECTLEFTRVSEGFATLAIRIPSKYVRRVRKGIKVSGAQEAARALRTVLLKYALETALKDKGVRVVTRPMLADGSNFPDVAEHQTFECTLGLDLALDRPMPDLSGIELVQPETAVPDELVEDEVAAQCRQFGTRSPAEAVQRGDECNLTVELRVNASEQPIFSAAKLDVFIPERGDALPIQGQQLQGIVQPILGARPGEKREFQAPFPSTFAVHHLRNTMAHATVTIHSAARITPAPLEAVLKEYGMPSADRLRTQIRFALEDKRMRDCAVVLREQLAELLPGLVSVAPPPMRSRFLRMQASRQFIAAMQARGLSAEECKQEWEEHKADIEARADRQASVRLILPSLSGHLQLTFDEDAVAGVLSAIAAERGVRPEQVRAELVQSGRYDDFLSDISAERLLDKLVEMCNKRTVTNAEWEEILQGKNRAT